MDKLKMFDKALEKQDDENMKVLLQGYFNQEYLLNSANVLTQDSDDNLMFRYVIERSVRLAQIGLFDYENLPKELKYYDFEDILFKGGKGAFCKIGGEFYVLPFITDGKIDLRGEPLRIKASFPNGKVSNWLEVGKQAVIIKNDIDAIATRMLISPFVKFMIDGWKSYKGNMKASLIKWLLLADETKDVANLKAELQKIMDSAGSVAVVKTEYAERIKDFEFYEAFDGTKIWDGLQNVYDFMFNQLGLFTASKDKKERMVVDEANANKDKIGTILESMFKARLERVKQINEIFELNIKFSCYVNYEENQETQEKEVEQEGEI